MTQINMPSHWSSPKFVFGQQVGVKRSTRTGYIIGLEYLEANHYCVVAKELQKGWYYIIQCHGKSEILNLDEDEIFALAPALATVG